MSVAGWNKDNILKFSIDYENVDESLTDFPVLLNLSPGSGKNNFDCSALFDELTVVGESGDGYTKLLIHSDTANNSTEMVDSSNSTHNVTAVAATHHSTLKQKFGGSSINFAGVSDYLSISNSTDFDFGEGNLTIDFWINFSTIKTVDFFRLGSAFIFFMYPAQNSIAVYIDGVYTGATSNNFYPEINIWYHIAVVNNGGDWVIYQDGVSISPGTFTGAVPVSVEDLYIMGGTVDRMLDGYMEEFKVSKGIARWTSDFTVPTIPYTNTFSNNKKVAVIYPSVQEHWISEYDSYTKILIRSNTNDGSIDFVDSSNYKHVISVNGDTYHTTAQAKLGSSAICFDGDGDYLSTPYSEDWNIYGGDFTVDLWLKITIAETAFILGQSNTSTSVLATLISTSTANKIKFWQNTSVTVETATSLVIGTWYHIAVVGYEGDITIYIDGVFSNSVTAGADVPVLEPFSIGRVGNYDGLYFTGYMDEFRISKGVARWTGDFTPPTSMYEKESVLKSYEHGEQEQLYCEIERWDQVNEEAQLWVKVPIVLSDQPTDLFLYYDITQDDNMNYIGDTGEWVGQQVWDDNFVFISHQGQDPSLTAPQILDSTVYASHGTANGTMTSEDLVNGQIGNSLDFDGIDDYINHGYNVAHDITNTLTLECNFLPSITYDSSLTTYAGFIERQTEPSAVDSYGLTLNLDGKLHLGTNGGSIQSTKAEWTAGTNFYLAGTYNSNGLVGDLFVDGIKEVLTSDIYDNMVGGSNDLNIGRYSTTINAKVDEVRISNVVRTDSWVKITHYSNNDTLMDISQADVYQITGYVKELGIPAQRTVYLYDRASGELMDKIISNALGYYTLRTTISGVHNLICLDADTSPDYNDLILSRVLPIETI